MNGFVLGIFDQVVVFDLEGRKVFEKGLAFEIPTAYIFIVR